MRPNAPNPCRVAWRGNNTIASTNSDNKSICMSKSATNQIEVYFAMTVKTMMTDITDQLHQH